MVERIRRYFDLQLFNEGGEGGQGGGEPTDPPAGGTEPPKGGEPTDPPKSDSEKKPFATFPDEKSFMSRVKREAEAQQKALLESLGVENADALKAILDADKKRKEDEMTETEKLQQQLNSLQSERDQALARAEVTARNTEAKLLATEIGVNPSKVNYFLKLADLSDVKVYKDGTVDSDAMKTRLQALLTEVPEFKGTPSAPPQGGGDFGGSNGQKPTLTREEIKGMTSAEIAERIDEVRAVLGQK